MTRVLLVDDEALLTRSIQRALSSAHDVVVADSGTKAIEFLAAGPAFDCVLCDLNMPGVSGADVYRWVAAHAPETADRFVVMTGGSYTEEHRQFLVNTACKRVEKPFDISTLRVLVDGVCRGAG